MFLSKRNYLDLVLILLFLFFFWCFFLYLKGSLLSSSQASAIEIQNRAADDEYDPSLSTLNSVLKIGRFCDSLFEAAPAKTEYSVVVAETIRKKFYHGYSHYNTGTNALCSFFAPVIGPGATAVVIPDDIAKYPQGACSQLSILAMEVLKLRNVPVRKVLMFDNVTKSGHFAYESFYDKGWHFFDADQEPDNKILTRYHQPSVAFLAANADIVTQAYAKKRDPQLFKRLVINFKTGEISKFPAPNAYLFQVVTKYMTLFGWIFFLGLLAIRFRMAREKYTSPVVFAAKKQARVALLS